MRHGKGWQLDLWVKLMSLTSALDVLYLDPDGLLGVCNKGSNSVPTILHLAAAASGSKKYL
jgi:hypothetical protein